MGTKRASNELLKRIVNDLMDEHEGYEYICPQVDLFNNAGYELQNRYFANEEINVSWWQMKALVECGVVISNADFNRIAPTYGETTRDMVKLGNEVCNHIVQHPSREETAKLLEDNKNSKQLTLF